MLRMEDLPDPDFPISKTLRFRDWEEVEPCLVGARTDILSTSSDLAECCE